MKRNYTIDPAVNEKAREALKVQGWSLSNYIRNALVHVAEGNAVPFECRDTGHKRGPKPKAKPQQ